MYAKATTRISILRGESEDRYGDEIALDDPVYTDIPASILDKTKTIFNQNTGAPMVVRSIKGRVKAGTDVQINDTILDQWTGARYAILDLRANQSMVRSPDIVMELRLVATGA